MCLRNIILGSETFLFLAYCPTYVCTTYLQHKYFNLTILSLVSHILSVLNKYVLKLLIMCSNEIISFDNIIIFYLI